MCLQEHIDEIYRKIGRNLMLFQRVEGLLKYILVFSNVAGNVSQLNDIKERRVNDIHKKSMGTLVNDHLNTESTCKKQTPDDIDSLIFSFELELSQSYYERKKDELKSLVNERNDLVHHSYLNYDLDSFESCQGISRQLDEQEKRIKEEINSLREIAKHIENFKKSLKESLESGSFIQEIKIGWLSNSLLVLLLRDLANQLARKDGWTSLHKAVDLIYKTNPDEKRILEKKYGYKSFKELMLESEIFEIIEEPTKKGGERVLYRVKSQVGL